MEEFNLDLLSPEQQKKAQEEADKIMFMADFSKTLEIEYENDNKIALVELITEAPIKLVMQQLLFEYIKNNYEMILTRRILTQEEKELFKKFHENYESTMEYLKFLIQQYRDEQEQELAKGGK